MRRDWGGGRRGDGRGEGRREGAGGAGHLARIHGTEQDRVNCPFYFKMGACRHGDKCDRQHNRPAFSQTVMIPQMYQNPLAHHQVDAEAGPNALTSQKLDREFDNFYADVFEEFQKFGEIEEMIVCNNLCDHLLGNVYVRFVDEEDADKCLKGIKGRYYAGKSLDPEFSPVTDFVQARCGKYDQRRCDRGSTCSYMHVKRVDRNLERDLLEDQPFRGQRSRGRAQSRSPSRDSRDSYSSSSRSGRSRSRSRSRSRGRERSTRRSRSRSRSYGDRRRSHRSRSPRSRPSRARRSSQNSYSRSRSRRGSRRDYGEGRGRSRSLSSSRSRSRSRSHSRARTLSRSRSRSPTPKRDVVDSMLGPMPEKRRT